MDDFTQQDPSMLDPLAMGEARADDALMVSEHERLALAQTQAMQQAKAVAVALGQQLHAEYRKRRGDRQQLERRWLDDINQYNSVYSREFMEALRLRKYGSRTFVPLTRRICNIVEARLGDLLFPTDDRNFVISASPKPDLADGEDLAKQLPDAAPVSLGGGEVATAGAVKQGLRELREDAIKRATNMQRLVDDQLQECNYSKASRRAIHDAIKIGTGIIKGPSVFTQNKKSWRIESGVAVLEVVQSTAPQAVHVDPWCFFPDMAVSDLRDSEGFFELHRLTSARLAKLADQDGFDREAIAEILAAKATHPDESHMAAQREASGTVGTNANRYNIVEYNGPISADQLTALGVDLPDDPLMIYEAVVWFSEWNGTVIKAVIQPLETGDPIYSVFCWQKDGASIFGFGLPYEIRDMQDAANSSFRAAQDNMGLSVGPQLVVNSKKITPVNGQWTIEPNKVWDLADGTQDVKNVFGFFQVDSRLSELLNMFQAAKAMADEIGGPMMAMQGQDAPSYVQAGATGMAIAYNAASVWMRRAVRQWDDDITATLVQRFVDWNMLYSDDPDIKGDVHVVCRGTSALLEAEGQTQRIQLLMTMSNQLGVPVRKVVNQLRQMALAMRLDPEDLLPSDDEVKEMEQARQAQAQAQQPNPDQQRLQLQQAELQDRAVQREHEAQMTAQSNQIRMAELAAKQDLSMQELQTKYGFEAAKMHDEMADRAAQRAHAAQALNAELAMKAAKGSGI